MQTISFGQYLSFEYLGIVLKHAPLILFIIIYRPPKYSPTVTPLELNQMLRSFLVLTDIYLDTSL